MSSPENVYDGRAQEISSPGADRAGIDFNFLAAELVCGGGENRIGVFPALVGIHPADGWLGVPQETEFPSFPELVEIYPFIPAFYPVVVGI